MNILDDHSLKPSASVLTAIKRIDASSGKIVLVVDENKKLIGTITDGDIRRGILRGITLDKPVTILMNKSPKTISTTTDRDVLLAMMRQERIKHMPVVDAQGHVVGLETLDWLVQPEEKENWVVLMAGGLGQRLRPMTEDCPKPMLKVGGRPVLEMIIDKLTNQGFYRFFLSVNYGAEIVKSYFKDGKHLGVEIQYLEETEALGTAGSLALLPKNPSMPLIVMNGDILTNLNFDGMLGFHQEHSGAATLGVRQHNVQIPYGVVQVEDHHVLTILEKPLKQFFISAGIYILNPEIISLVETSGKFDMPRLFSKAKDLGFATLAFPIREQWLDIGKGEDLDRANDSVFEFL